MSHDPAKIWMEVGSFVDTSRFRNFGHSKLIDVMDSADIELASLKAGQKVIGEMMCLVATPEDFQSWVSREAFRDIRNLNATISSAIKMLEKVNQNISFIRGPSTRQKDPFE